MSKTVVEQTDNGVGPLPNNHTFVNEVADLKHTKKLYVLLPLCCISPAEGRPHSTLQIVRTSSVSGSRSVLAVEDRWGDGPAVQSRNCSGRSLLEVECLQQLVAAMYAGGLNVRFVTISIASLQTVERPLLGGSLEVLLIEPECLHVRFSIVLIDVMVGDCPDGEVIERLWAYL